MASKNGKKQRRSSKKKEDADSGWLSAPGRIAGSLSDTTRRAVVAIVFIVVAIILLLSAAGSAGPAGASIYAGLTYLFGVGYFLLPLLLFVLAGVLFTSIQPDIALVKTLGGILFLISGFGLIEALADGRGGLLGDLIASPTIHLFDVTAGAILLGAVLLVSIVMLLDGTFSVSDVTARLRREDAEVPEDAEAAAAAAEDAAEEDEAEAEEPAAEDDHEDVEEDEEAAEPAPSSGTREKTGLFGGSKKDKKGAESGEAEGVTIGAITGEVYSPPPLNLLSKDKGKPGSGDIKANANLIKRTLQNFGIDVELDEIAVGPTVTRYAIKPAEGVRLSRIVSLQNNLELALAASPVRIEAPIPGRSLVGIEVPNTTKSKIGLATLLGAEQFQQTDKPLLTALGKSISGEMHFANIAKMPHMLVAGATGSGKSVMIHSILLSLLYQNSPENMRLIMVDPKRVELSLYKNTPHLLTPVITDPKKAILALKWAAQEMTRRYDILEAETVRDIGSYHEKVLAPARQKLAQQATSEDGEVSDEDLPEPMPYIVIIIDEMADLMQAYPKELESAIVRLAQMSRAVGIHLILSTQRPSVNVITGLIKANIPARIALQVSSQVDSRTILDSGGAERLLGAGDMLYSSGDMAKPQRLQSPFVSEEEVKSVVQWLSKRYEQDAEELSLSGNDSNGSGSGENGEDGGAAIFDAVEDPDAEPEDDLFEQARSIVVNSGKASTSYLQRRLRIGYSRAARLVDTLEERGIIGPAEGSKPREVFERPDDASSTSSHETNQELLTDDEPDDGEDASAQRAP